MALKRKTQTQIISNGIVRGIAESILRFVIAPAIVAAIFYVMINEDNEERLTYTIVISGLSSIISIFISLITKVKEEGNEELSIDSDILNDFYVDSDDSKKSS